MDHLGIFVVPLIHSLLEAAERNAEELKEVKAELGRVSALAERTACLARRTRAMMMFMLG